MHTRVALTSAQKAALPDEAFAWIGPDGERHFPYRHADGSLDEEHVRKGLQLLSTAKIPASAKAKVRRILLSAAKQLGIETSADQRVGSGGSVVGRKVERSASDPAMPGLRAPAPGLTRAVLPCTVRIADEERREIEVCATSEAVDSYGTVFSYEASRDAFTRWAGNVREMHERRAVGRKVAVRFDDEARRVYARLRISAGAQDTWEKVKDGTLAGASIGASNVTWDHQRVGDRSVPVATRYDLMELSLVDLPSNPDASGVLFVRDGVPDAALLDDVVVDVTEAERGAESPGSSGGSSIGSAVAFREGAGVVASDDPAAAIAAAALTRAHTSVTAAPSGAPVQSAKQARLAALGAPGYVQRSVEPARTAQTTRADNGPGSSYDGDGDHDGNVPAGQGDGMDHSEDLHTHASHEHAHTGDWENTHAHSGAHVHLDGTSHTHDHSHSHDHHDHNSMRVQRSHSHTHVHTHDHGHYYRVADGSPIDESLVTGEQLRLREYVSEEAFRAAGGRDGTGLSAAQYRVAAGVEARLEMEAAERAQGAYSRNPYGAADIGTPAPADQPSTEDAQPSTGQVRQLDRDGQLAACETESSTGTLDVSQAPDGYMELTGVGPTPLRDGWAVAASGVQVTRAVSAEITRIAGTLSDIQQRLAKIEAQPQSGGPVLRVADKGTPLSPSGSSPAERIRVLEGLAGRISDPQAQVAVAAEMIRLQQEAMGLPPAMQVMPRAGMGGSGAR